METEMQTSTRSGLYTIPAKFEDLKKSVELYGRVHELNELGVHYYKGDGTPVDYVKAADCFLKSAKLGWASAMANLVGLYDDGHIDSMTKQERDAWLRRAAELGLPRAMFLYATEQDDKEAFYWLDLASKLGHLESTYELAIRKAKGQGCEKNVCAALEDFIRVKESEAWGMVYPIEQCKLGNPDFEFLKPAFSSDGNLDNEELVRIISATLDDYYKREDLMLQQKAESGDTYAIGKLASDAFQKDQDVEKFKKSIQKAVDKGDGSATFFLGLVKQDVDLIAKAAELGYGEASVQLGIYYWDQGDPVRALEILIDGAHKGIEGCQNTLAFCISIHEYLPQQPAVYWYKQAARFNEKASAGLRILARSGVDISQDYSLDVVRKYEDKVLEKFLTIKLMRGEYKNTSAEEIRAVGTPKSVVEATRRLIAAGHNLRTALCSFLWSTGSVAEAINVGLEAASAGVEDSDELYLQLGLAFQAKGDNLKAIDYFKRSADSGFDFESSNLVLPDTALTLKTYIADILLKERGHEEDGKKMMEALAEQGDEMALICCIGRCWWIHDAVAWATKGFEHGFQFAAYYLGRVYMYGCSVPQDIDKAYDYFVYARDHVSNVYALAPDLIEANLSKASKAHGSGFSAWIMRFYLNWLGSNMSNEAVIGGRLY